MDDERFDDIIKNKVGDYTDPVFDEGAIAGLHQHLAAHQVLPWYTQYKHVGLMAATLALFTLINWLMIRNTGNPELNQAGINNNINYEALIDDLRDEINRLKSVQRDTLFISRIDDTQRTPNPTAPSPVEVDPDQIINTFLLRLKDGQQIGKIGEYFFYHESDIPTHEEFIALNHRDSQLLGSALSMSYPNEDTIYKEIVRPQADEITARMPIIVIRDLEKHYSKGIGLKIGPSLELAHTKPKVGGGEFLPGGGILSELVFSPSLGLETGFIYKTRSYDLENSTNQDLSSFPGINSTLGNVSNLEGDAKLIEIPLNLKFYRTISQNKDIYILGGISPNLYLSQAFEYNYSPSPDLPTEAVIQGEAKISGPDFYIGTVNAGVGMSIDLPRERTVQVGMFYQKDLAGIGVENQKLNVFGLKSSYWFRVR